MDKLQASEHAQFFFDGFWMLSDLIAVKLFFELNIISDI